MTLPSDDPCHLHGQSPARNPGQDDAVQFFDPRTYQDFIDLMGREQARFWLEEFRLRLSEELVQSSGHDLDLAASRASIHQTCARAGIIGFRALHQSCLAFLEADTDAADPESSYRAVCAEAARVVPEIERQSALLA